MSARAASPPNLLDVDFAKSPFTLAWEITRACGLACIHCRAVTQPRRDPAELTTAEGLDLVDQVAEMGTKVFVVTGGDPLMRPDCFDFIRRARERGMQVGFSPSATGRLTRVSIGRALESGVHRLHLSLDGATPGTHDRFRGVRGSFDRTMRAMRDAREVGLPLQIGTTVTRDTETDLPAIVEILRDAGVAMWSAFFLVPTGRAQQEQMLDAEGHERVMTWLAGLPGTVPFDVRTTAGMQFRRIVAQKLSAGPANQRVTGAGFSFGGPGRPMRAVNDGDGFCFVSHTGDVAPSGFLPLVAGNVRQQPLAQIYREAPLFKELRDKTLLKGRCAVCEFREPCGGSRARSWALTGDYLAEDPSCLYTPHAFHSREQPVA
jgi:radical SAM protein